ncbi:MAG TPA: TetR/AcrR family transcriptional regulator [Baekduia sp.]|uniref:TetR/AcrR family transcriptional regulator n=1 Tax=Baekduia sp. TaxID=2600305 RepID=UPI002CB41A0A|nr:TetR/AcrR family transcriptional regulator [Baekduia sp.]HMJ37182.1 TetR/AcrR family transcriptional regulator [Baekduia sp.]
MTVARPYHHGNLREALLCAGEGALETGGVQGLSLRELAREVGVSHAAPRRHFPDRQALLDALAESGFARLGAALSEAVAAAGPHFDARLAGLARAYIAFATARPALTGLMFAAKHQAGAPPSLRAAAEQAFSPALTAVAEGQTAGEVAPGDPERVALVASAALQGIVVMANNGMLGETPVDELLDDVTSRLVLGLRPR